jgi:hypothetical protein
MGFAQARVVSVCVTKKSENSRLCAKGRRGEKDLDEGGQVAKGGHGRQEKVRFRM